jgi:hypothetical protein
MKGIKWGIYGDRDFLEVSEMFKMPNKIEYALPEVIGDPELFTGRKKEFAYFFGSWYELLERNIAPCMALLSRRKKGKTAFLQRFFNILWSLHSEKSPQTLTVIPFYYSISDFQMPMNTFAKDFFTTFVNHYLSFRMGKRELINTPVDFNQIPFETENKIILQTHKAIMANEETREWEKMWMLASETPARIARAENIKIIQLIDEFQNINEYITNIRETVVKLSGTYMRVAEMREAPLIVSGSEVHWLLRIVSSLTGRFRNYNLENLPKKEAEEAIEKYASSSKTIINSEAKEKIWNLTKGDPLYIKSIFISRFNRKKDYTIDENILDVYEKEIQQGEIYGTWMEYMVKTFDTVNKINSKRIMLYLFQQGEERTREQIKKALKLPYTDEELETKLEALIKGDLISQGSSAYRYTITKDKTYELFFTNKYQDEIDHFVPDIKAELRKEIGLESYLKGKFMEFLIKEKMKNPFNLNALTVNGEDLKIVPLEIEERKFIKTGVRNSEIDVYIRAQKGYSLYIDVKNTKIRYGKRQLERWLRIANCVRENDKKAIFLVYSESGYTLGTAEKLDANGIKIIKNSL